MEKGAFMRKELREGPEGVRKTLKEAREQVKASADLLRRLAASGVYRGFIIGSGTSFHASLYLEYLLNKLTDFHVTAVPASEFAAWRPAKMERSFIIGYSQSGESSDIVEAFNVARGAGVKTIAITNTPGSTLTRISDACIVTRAGEEKAVAATKTFDSQLAAALMLAFELSARSVGEIEKAADAAEKVLESEEQAKTVAERFVKAEHAFCLGRGPAFPVALEAALKLKEAAMVHAEGFAVREFLHGPLQLVDESTPVFVYAASRAGFEESVKALERIAGYKAPITLLGPGAAHFSSYASSTIEVPDAGNEATAIPLAKIAQLLAYHLSTLKGLNPDKPTKLTKIVKYQ